MTLRLSLVLLALCFLLDEARAQTSVPSAKAKNSAVAPAKAKPKVPTAEEIADALNQAKTSYEEKLKAARKVGEDGLDASMKLARKNQDPALVAQIEDDKKRFAENILKIPMTMNESSRKKVITRTREARFSLDKAYGVAIGAYTSIALDDEAKKLLTERQTFLDEVPVVRGYVSPNPGMPQQGGAQPQMVKPLLPPGGVWKFKTAIAPGLGQEGWVNIRGNEMYHTDAPANPIGMAAMDGPDTIYLTFAGHRKIPAGEAVLFRQRVGFWSGTLTRAGGISSDIEMYR